MSWCDLTHKWQLPATNSSDFDVIEPLLSTRCALFSLLQSAACKLQLQLPTRDVTCQLLDKVEEFATHAREAERWQVRAP